MIIYGNKPKQVATESIKRKLFLFFAITTIASNCFSQDETDIVNITKVTFLNPGISQELRIGKLQSIYLQAFMNTSAYFTYSSSFGSESAIYFDPAVTGQYRYYYNAAKRADKDKRTEMNSLNYVGGVVETFFSKIPLYKDDIFADPPDEPKRRAVTRIGAIWGIQRNGMKRFSLDLNLGLGYMFGKTTNYDFNTGETYSSNRSQVTMLGQLNLGFWLNRREE
jgi:hypothetical protein